MRIIERLSDLLKICGGVCLVGMMVVTCADVVGRLFLHPILGSVEIVTFMATLAMAMALPHTHQVKGHIGVEILVRRLPRKTQTVIDLCTGVLSLGLFALVTWRMAIYANTIRRSGEYSANLKVPEYLVISLVALSCLIFALVIVLDLVQTLQKSRRA